MIVIIKVINNKTQISFIERTIACVNDNETSYREFQIPRYINDVDLAEYSAKIEIQPIDETETPYYDLVQKIVNEDNLIIKWIIKSHNTKDEGKLYFDLHFSKDDGASVKIYQTQIDYFVIAGSVNAEQQSEIIPPSVFEQAVMEVVYQVDLAKQYRDEIVDKSGNLEDLVTEQKLDLVSAINELVGRIDILEGLVNELLIPESYQVLIVPKG